MTLGDESQIQPLGRRLQTPGVDGARRSKQRNSDSSSFRTFTLAPIGAFGSKGLKQPQFEQYKTLDRSHSLSQTFCIHTKLNEWTLTRQLLCSCKVANGICLR